MKYLLSFYFFFISASLIAQDSSKASKWHYFGLHGAGLVAGSSTQSLSLLTTNGLATGNWYAGITTGIDWYGVRSIPVLADVHKAFGKSKNQPFVYGNAGLSCPWEKATQRNYRAADVHFRNSFMGEAGLGYFISLKNKTALSLSVGYSYKTVRTKGNYYNDVYIIGGPAPYYTSGFDNTQHFRRIAIRVSIKI